MIYCVKCLKYKSENHFHKSTKNRCKECISKYARDRMHNDPVKYKLKAMIKGARRRAKLQKVPFDIDGDWLVTQFGHLTHCPATGVKFEWTANRVKSKNSPTLDKFIPEKGYVKGNVHVISARANSMKSNASTDTLIMFAQWILKQSSS